MAQTAKTGFALFRYESKGLNFIVKNAPLTLKDLRLYDMYIKLDSLEDDKPQEVQQPDRAEMFKAMSAASSLETFQSNECGIFSGNISKQ